MSGNNVSGLITDHEMAFARLARAADHRKDSRRSNFIEFYETRVAIHPHSTYREDQA